MLNEIMMLFFKLIIGLCLWGLFILTPFGARNSDITLYIVVVVAVAIFAINVLEILQVKMLMRKLNRASDPEDMQGIIKRIAEINVCLLTLEKSGAMPEYHNLIEIQRKLMQKLEKL